MSPANSDSECCQRGFPRVSGDEPAGIEALCEGVRFSPRERG